MRLLTFIILSILTSVAHCQWENRYFNLDHDIEGVHFFSENNLIVYGHSGNVDGNGYAGAFILRTQDLGLTWDTSYFYTWSFQDMSFPTNDTGFAIGTYNNGWWGSFKTTDGGYTWAQTSQNMFGSPLYSSNIDCYDTQTCICGSSGNRHITTDGGVNWNVINNHPWGSGGPERSLLIDSIYIESNDYWLSYSLDTLLSYEPMEFTQGSDIEDIMLYKDSIIVPLFFSNVNIFSYDIGEAKLDSFSLDNFGARGVDYSDESEDLYLSGIFAGSKAVAKSEDAGATWYLQSVNDVLPSPWNMAPLGDITVYNDTIAVAWHDPYVFITKNGGGPLGQQLQKVTSVQEFSQVQTALYPNPTTGFLTLNSSQIIEGVQVFSLEGKLVQSLTINQKSYNLDISHLHNGHYIIQIKTSKGTETKKVVKI